MSEMLKMRHFGHVMRAYQFLEKVIMLGLTAGARKKGKPRMLWMDDIKSVTGLSVNYFLMQERRIWRSLENNIVKKRKRASD